MENLFEEPTAAAAEAAVAYAESPRGGKAESKESKEEERGAQNNAWALAMAIVKEMHPELVERAKEEGCRLLPKDPSNPKNGPTGVCQDYYRRCMELTAKISLACVRAMAEMVKAGELTENMMAEFAKIKAGNLETRFHTAANKVLKAAGVPKEQVAARILECKIDMVGALRSLKNAGEISAEGLRVGLTAVEHGVKKRTPKVAKAKKPKATKGSANQMESESEEEEPAPAAAPAKKTRKPEPASEEAPEGSALLDLLQSMRGEIHSMARMMKAMNQKIDQLQTELAAQKEDSEDEDSEDEDSEEEAPRKRPHEHRHHKSKRPHEHRSGKHEHRSRK